VADFYTDHDVARKVAELLRAAGQGAVTARDLRLESATDDEQLLVAAQHGRIFATHNESDFILLHDAWHRWSTAWGVSAQHAGIVIVPQGRKYGRDWDAVQIATELVLCLKTCAPLASGLFRRKEAGWERRQGRRWVSVPSGTVIP
jgi:hypothetical protein